MCSSDLLNLSASTMPSLVRMLEAMPYAQRQAAGMAAMGAITSVCFTISASSWGSVGTYDGAQAGVWSEASPQYMKFQNKRTVALKIVKSVIKDNKPLESAQTVDQLIEFIMPLLQDDKDAGAKDAGSAKKDAGAADIRHKVVASGGNGELSWFI